MPTRISREDIADADIVDATELASDGHVTYKTGSVVFASGSLLTASFPAIDIGFQDFDDPAGAPDFLILSGTGNADGTYVVLAPVAESILQISGTFSGSIQGGTHSGSWKLIYAPGAKTVGIDTTTLAFSSSIPSDVMSYVKEDTYQRLLEDDPAGIGVNENITYAGSRVTSETWKRASDNSLLKNIDYTYTGSRVTQEVRKVYAEDGTRVVAQKTVVYTYSGNSAITVSSSRDI